MPENTTTCGKYPLVRVGRARGEPSRLSVAASRRASQCAVAMPGKRIGFSEKMRHSDVTISLSYRSKMAFVSQDGFGRGLAGSRMAFLSQDESRDIEMGSRNVVLSQKELGRIIR